MRTTGPGNARQRRRRMTALGRRDEIGPGHDADQSPVAIDHRQAADLLLAPVARDVGGILVLEAVPDLAAHDVAPRADGAFPAATPRTAMSRSVIIPTSLPAGEAGKMVDAWLA